LENVVCNVQSGAHTSDVNASSIKGSSAPAFGGGLVDYLKMYRKIYLQLIYGGCNAPTLSSSRFARAL
jgi:hypothetical protein